ncbi:mesoderm induction early response protein 2 [Aplochiton taeniatus]
MKMAAGPHTASELPLEDLLKLCGYGVSEPPLQPRKEHPGRLAAMTLDKEQIAKDLYPGEEEESPEILSTSVTSRATDRLPHHPRDQDEGKLSTSSSGEDSDDDSIPSNEERKDIMVGSMYQAKIPPLSPYSAFQERACDGEDQLLWSPGVLSSQAVEEFLLSAQRRDQGGVAPSPLPGDTVKDSEQALFELVKCNFNVEEALRRLRFNVKVFSEELCGWSEEECRGFEHGYRVYGKNFHLIQGNKVRTRSVWELVEYYYMWKKSERYEYFTQQTTKMGRRKYNLYSGSMEDGEQDGEVADLERDCSSHSSAQHDPPSTQPALALAKRVGDCTVASSSGCVRVPPLAYHFSRVGGGSSQSQTNAPLSFKALSSLHTGHTRQPGPQVKHKLGMRMLELCGAVCPSPPAGQQLFSPFSPLLAMEGLSGLLEPTLNSLSPGSCPPSPPGQLQFQSHPLSPGAYSPVDPHHLGSGFYQFQLQGPFLPEGLSAEPDCGTAAGGGAGQRLQLDFALPPPCPLSPSIAPSEFGGISSFLGPAATQHPCSLTQSGALVPPGPALPGKGVF